MKVELEQDVKGLLPEKDYDRRDFIWTALGASAALAVASSATGQTVNTDANGLDVADVMIPAKDVQLRGYRAMPASGGRFPVVLVAAEIFGLNPYIKDVCRRLAKAGYYAVVPDLYTRKADLTKVTDMKDIMPVVNTKYDTELVSDYDATVAYAQGSGKADANRMAITGFCRGGRTALIYAESNPKLKAACAWYGPVGGQPNEYTPKTAMDRVAEMKVPVLGLYGAKDAGIPVDQVQKFFAALTAARYDYVVSIEHEDRVFEGDEELVKRGFYLSRDVLKPFIH